MAGCIMRLLFRCVSVSCLCPKYRCLIYRCPRCYVSCSSLYLSISSADSFQFVAFTTGLAHVTLPNSTDEAWIRGGKYGLVIAADTAAVSLGGHITRYPSDDMTIGLQMPTSGGVVPKHTVLHTGACKHHEQIL